METLSRAPTAVKPHADLARSMAAHRDPIGEATALAFDLMPRWKRESTAHALDRPDFVATNFHAFADYLAEYFRRDDPVYKHLFVGEMVKALYEPELDEKAAAVQSLAVVRDLRERYARVLGPALPPSAARTFDVFLGDIERVLTAPSVKTQRVLLVGDCLFLDIVPFIVSELLDSGIRLVPDFVASKNPALLKDELRAASSKRFDLVFFSPFSHDFSPELASVLQWRQALVGEAVVREAVDGAWARSKAVIDLLADLFDCPIHIHNAAAVVREENAVKRLLKMGATAKTRAAVRVGLNLLLTQHVEATNLGGFRHLFVFDESRFVQAAGEFAAGAFFYATRLQHPSAMGPILAGPYVDLVYSHAWLAKRKVVVCDLDNTLWDGVIGEGAVTHFHDRQQTLLALKAKGVVLAVNSKNDPANVHWRDGTLTSADFVHEAISWEPKVQGMKRIQAALNLNMKDYVFVDDREDELSLMRSTYPEILCLDATDAATWRRLDAWAMTLENDSEMDRTLMYRQREERKAFVREDISSDAERQALFETLQLKLTITEAGTGDLKRVAELINRTNQFNLEGSRTSLREVTAWHQSPDHLVLLGQTADRFGDMGTTCIAVAAIEGAKMRLLPFVLSCRVFGYGIEHAVMDRLVALARQRGVERISGRYVPTPVNAPCKDFLPHNGFEFADGEWVRVVAVDAPATAPAWLSVEHA